MTRSSALEILVIGVTGTQGRAVARNLLARGMKVRGLTRNPSSGTARALAQSGVTMLQGDLDTPETVESAMRGVDGVYLVTEFFKNGIAGELRHGKLVADLVAKLGIKHLIHSSVAGADRAEEVPHFASKAEIERHVRSLGIPATILRPAIFLEDLTEKQYFPPASFGMMPKLVGPDRPLKWVSVDDLGAAAAEVFLRRDEYLGKTIALVGDEKSMNQAREIFTKIDGKRPFALPMPTFLFRRLVSEDLTLMWIWLSTHSMEGDVAETRALVPAAKDMATYLSARRRAAA